MIEAGSQVQNITSIIQQILTMIMVIVVGISLIMTIRLNRWSKGLETTSIYLQRYGDILKDLELLKQGKLESDSFWLRFWYLQQEQFILWEKGLIDKEFFKIWMDYRRKEWEKNEIIQDKTYQDNWQNVAEEMTDKFRRFMESVFQNEVPAKIR